MSRQDPDYDRDELLTAAERGIERIENRLDGKPLSQRFFELETRRDRLRNFRAMLEAEGVQPPRFPEGDG
ncbi:MAG: hypothetical protein ACI9CA_000009 [Natronomonas sp.]|jgi:hypothetical protein